MGKVFFFLKCNSESLLPSPMLEGSEVSLMEAEIPFKWKINLFLRYKAEMLALCERWKLTGFAF